MFAISDLGFVFSPGGHLEHETSEQQLVTSYPGRNAENASYREDRFDSIACLLLPVMFSGDITAAPCPYTHESA